MITYEWFDKYCDIGFYFRYTRAMTLQVYLCLMARYTVLLKGVFCLSVHVGGEFLTVF